MCYSPRRESIHYIALSTFRITGARTTFTTTSLHVCIVHCYFDCTYSSVKESIPWNASEEIVLKSILLKFLLDQQLI